MILDIINEAKSWLESQPFFAAGVPVVSVNDKDLGNSVDAFLSKIGGVGVLLGTPECNGPVADISNGQTSVYFNDISLVATIFENVLVNRSATGTPLGSSPSYWAPGVAEMVSILLHQHRPVGIAETIVCTRGPRIIPPPPNTDKRILCYDVWFKTEGGVKNANQPPTVATPSITFADIGGGLATVTIACASPAVVFWSADGSYPGPFNADGSQKAAYSAPVTVSVPCTVQARAWYPGWIASAVAKQAVT